MTFRQEILLRYLWVKYIIIDAIEDTLIYIFRTNKRRDKWVV